MMVRSSSGGLRAGSLYFRVQRRLVRRKPASLSLGQARSNFYRTIWEQAAATVGASVSCLGGSLLEIRFGEQRLRVSDNLTSLDDPLALRVAGDKPLVHRLLRQDGIPVPEFHVCKSDDLSAAWRFAAGHTPCVVKPARATGGGDGVTAGVADRLGLALALALAGAYCKQAVIEQQIAGGNYRLLYFDGELLDAVLRSPPTVTGDGRSTLAELVAKDNADRSEHGISASQTLLRVDRELAQTVASQGYRMRSVPVAGVVVRLKSVVSDNRAGDNHRVTDVVSAAVVETGARAARTVGARLAGVDMILPDPALPLEQSGGVVIEVNTTPGFYYHYFTSSGSLPVCDLIIQRVFEGWS